jgi:hypothetical protein
MFPLPKVELTAAEAEEEQRLDAIRAKRREYNRRYQARRKVKDKVLQPVEPRQPAEEKPAKQPKSA